MIAVHLLPQIAKMRDFNLAGGVNSRLSALDRTIARYMGSASDLIGDSVGAAGDVPDDAIDGNGLTSAGSGLKGGLPSKLSRRPGSYQQIEL